MVKKCGSIDHPPTPPIRWTDSLKSGRISDLELIGKGAFALVYKAKYRHELSTTAPTTTSDQTSCPSTATSSRSNEVAVKVLQPNLHGHPSSRSKFLNEVTIHRKASRVHHDSIVRFIGTTSIPLSSLIPMTPLHLILPPGSPIAQAASELYTSSAAKALSQEQKGRLDQALSRNCAGRACWALVIEYCSSGSLYDCLSSQLRSSSTTSPQLIKPPQYSYTMVEAVRWLQEIASGLSHLHSQSQLIIHRDIKLENLLLTSSSSSSLSKVKICDLGLAIEVDLDRGVKIERRDILQPPLLSLRYLARCLIKQGQEVATNTVDETDNAHDHHTSNAPSCFQPKIATVTRRRRSPSCTVITRSISEEDQQAVLRRALSLDLDLDLVKSSTSSSTAPSGNISTHNPNPNTNPNTNPNPNPTSGSVQNLFARQRQQAPTPSDLLHVPDLHVPTFNLTGRVGSIMYLAPEVARGQPYNERCDIFSFGMIMWELTSRRLLSEAFLPKSLKSNNEKDGNEKEEEEEDAVAGYIQRVAWEGWRPQPPPWLPPDYQLLMKLCMHQDARVRPTAATLMSLLSHPSLIQAATAKDSINRALEESSFNINPLFQETPASLLVEPSESVADRQAPLRTSPYPPSLISQPLGKSPVISQPQEKSPVRYAGPVMTKQNSLRSEPKRIEKKDLPWEATLCAIS